MLNLKLRTLATCLLVTVGLASVVAFHSPSTTESKAGQVNCQNCEDACNDEAWEFYINCVNNCGAGEWCQNFCIWESYCKKKRCGLRDCSSCNWVTVAFEDCPSALEEPEDPEPTPEPTPTPGRRKP